MQSECHVHNHFLHVARSDVSVKTVHRKHGTFRQRSTQCASGGLRQLLLCRGATKGPRNVLKIVGGKSMLPEYVM